MDMLKRKDVLYLDRLPKWKASEGQIPIYKDNFFHFCCQIPDNETEPDEIFFLFVTISENDELFIQIHTEFISQQTAEDHYKLEEDIALFNQKYQELNVVEDLIKKGDKFLHEYILNHKKTNLSILEILSENAKTKTFKKEVLKKIKTI